MAEDTSFPENAYPLAPTTELPPIGTYGTSIGSVPSGSAPLGPSSITGNVPPTDTYPLPPIPAPGPAFDPVMYGQPLQPATNSLTVASFALALISWIVPLFFLVGSIPAVICGHIGLKQVRETQESGRSLAIAGLVLGYIPIAAIILVLAIGAITSTAISIFGLTIQL